MDKQELLALGKHIGAAFMLSNWVLGKFADNAIRNFDLKKFAEAIREDCEELKQYAYVYQRFIKENPQFDIQKYVGIVCWEILAMAAAKSDTPAVLVDELISKGIVTVEDAYQAIRTVK